MIAVHDGTIHEFRDGRLNSPDSFDWTRWRSFSLCSFGQCHSLREVKKGDVIAICGNTVPGGTGPHLHFESMLTYMF